jgi:hypothetical protein
LFDGTPVDAPHAGFLGRVADGLPHAIRNVAWADRVPVLTEIAAELQRRLDAHDSEAPPLYLFVFALQRFRELRRGDDDFGFGKKDDKPNPSRLMETILSEGPAVGIHTLLWCDTLANLQRVVDRQGMRNFEMRVLFQMSANDSSTLIDSPAASKLGLHRALFSSEEQGLVEKFRPYGMPDEAWLAEVKTTLQKRV